MAEIANLLVRFPLPPLLNVTDRSGYTRKPSMLTTNLSSPSLRSLWRSRRVSRNSRRPRRICTKRYRLGETEVGRNSDMGFLTHDEGFSYNLASRHGCRDGTPLGIQDIQFPVLQANFRLSVYHVYCSGISAYSSHSREKLIPFPMTFSRGCSLVTTMV